MGLLDEVRTRCAEIAATARDVDIELDALEEIEPAPPPQLDARCHYLEGSQADVADYILALDAINFGSGWFPLLAKSTLEGKALSGYFTVALALADYVRAGGTLSAAWMRSVDTSEIAEILGQDPNLELISLYAQAFRALGRFLGARRALDAIAAAEGSAERLAQMLAAQMPMFADHGFYKRAQIAANDLALAGVATFADLDRLTIFADNLVPHVLRCDGILRYSDALAHDIDAGRVLPLGGVEREIRACAVHACELIAQRTGVPPRTLDNWLWSKGQAPRYKAKPRHRCRCVFY